MIQLNDGCFLPKGRHDITGKLEEVIVTNNKIEEVCKNIIKNEFMSEVEDWGCNFENLLDPEVGMGDTYAEALSNADWNCTKYYVHLAANDNTRLFKVIDIKEDSDDDIFDIKKNDDGTFDFHVRFVADEDEDMTCLSDAIDKCNFKENN